MAKSRDSQKDKRKPAQLTAKEKKQKKQKKREQRAR